MRVLVDVVEELARRHELVGYRVVYRSNPRGEHVVSIIWPPDPA